MTQYHVREAFALHLVVGTKHGSTLLPICSGYLHRALEVWDLRQERFIDKYPIYVKARQMTRLFKPERNRLLSMNCFAAKAIINEMSPTAGIS